tara:strand:- start:35 stop:460 length:426 start_codon:yes stop_codon:yes gene_type:complete
MSILTEIGQLTAAILLGAMLFFAAVVAPLVFNGLDAATAGRFIRRMFPWYYLVIFVLASLATLFLLSGAPNNGAIMALVAAGAALSRQVLMPRINRLRDAQLAGDTEAGPRFDRLHRLSVWINSTQILALLWVVFGVFTGL